MEIQVEELGYVRESARSINRRAVRRLAHTHLTSRVLNWRHRDEYAPMGTVLTPVVGELTNIRRHKRHRKFAPLGAIAPGESVLVALYSKVEKDRRRTLNKIIDPMQRVLKAREWRGDMISERFREKFARFLKDNQIFD